MEIYTTKSGDTFDVIAFEQYGSSKYLPQLLRANQDKLQIYQFGAGVKINLPEVEAEQELNLPPWRT